MKKSAVFKNRVGSKCGGIVLTKAQSEKKANLYLYGEIVDEVWEKWTDDESKCPKDVLDIIAEIEDNEPIDIYINSPGGSVFAGTAIYNILRRHKGEKTVYIDGIAASIASVIAMVGDNIKMGCGATLMVHKPWTYGLGNADDLRQLAETLDVLQTNIMDIYESKLKNKEARAKVEEMVNKATYLKASEAAEIFNIEIDTNIENIMNKMSAFSDFTAEKTASPTQSKPEDIETELLKLELI